MPLDSIFDNSVGYSLKTQRDDETSGANKKAESQHDTRIVTKGPEETAKKFLKPASGNLFARSYKFCKSLITKENKPAPPVAKESTVSVSDRPFVYPFPSGHGPVAWNELRIAKLGAFSDKEFSVAAYREFKNGMSIAMDEAKSSVNALFIESTFKNEDRDAFLETCFSEFKNDLLNAVDEHYQKIRENKSSESKSMPFALTNACEAALITTLGEFASRSEDKKVEDYIEHVLTKFHFVLEIRDAAGESGLSKSKPQFPISFKFELKTANAWNDVATAEEPAEEVLTVAIWNPPFSSAKFLADKQSPDHDEVKAAATNAISAAPESPALDLPPNELMNLGHFIKTSQEALPLDKVDESEWIAPQPSLALSKASSESLISKDNKDAGAIERFARTLVGEKKISTMENPVYRKPVEPVAGERIEIAEHDLNAPAQDDQKRDSLIQTTLAKKDTGHYGESFGEKIKTSVRNGFESIAAKIKFHRGQTAFNRLYRDAYLAVKANDTSLKKEEIRDKAQAIATIKSEAISLLKEERRTAFEKHPFSRSIWFKDALEHPRFDYQSRADIYHAGTLPILKVIGVEITAFQNIADTAWANTRLVCVESEKDESKKNLMSQGLDDLQKIYKSASEDAYKEARATKKESAPAALLFAQASAIAAVNAALREPSDCDNTVHFEMAVARFLQELANEEPLIVRSGSQSAEKESMVPELSSSTEHTAGASPMPDGVSIKEPFIETNFVPLSTYLSDPRVKNEATRVETPTGDADPVLPPISEKQARSSKRMDFWKNWESNFGAKSGYNKSIANIVRKGQNF